MSTSQTECGQTSPNCWYVVSRQKDSFYTGISNFADQRAFITAKVSEDKEVEPSGGDPIKTEPGKIVERDNVVKNDEEDWNFKGIMVAKEA